ncbi:glycerol-3-phosphate dehydrogenase [Sedimenticola hydrogenitrophicus]|uniref:glycerol-3-phosphate dehydrogenase n=1 Tax=Sedimenticola hydrogenitrophicus TaxID=2967975 RepID=UPI0021A7BB16|nr:glycerol-3-phosphate dehydrogenase [Sedimenticola hydrogenitrophicus]
MSLDETQQPLFDLLVIGGGINGVGVARDAAGRGMQVYLCEKDDLAQHTSSASTKLIHGGLRYLEYYDFKLVRHALQEREVLLRTAPHIIHPMRFILPHHQALRPKWMIRIGLFLYDHLGGRKLLPSSNGVDLRRHPAGAALKSSYRAGFEYSDCWVHDARLVVLSARDAQLRGATVKTHTRCISLARHPSHWEATLRDERNGVVTRVQARAVVNAAGPWVEQVLASGVAVGRTKGVRFVKGSHIVVPKLFDHEYAYIFQHADGRVLFAIPFEQDYTLLGTTDIELASLPDKSEITPDEVEYICQAVSEYFSKPVRSADVVWSFSGVRPLYDDAASNASKVTRDYNLHLDRGHLDREQAPILSIFGGKITTYRKLAEEVLDLLSGCLPIEGGAWTAESNLPGGDMADADFRHFLAMAQKRYPELPEALIAHYVGHYGTDLHLLLAGCRQLIDLGLHFGNQLYEQEVRYLMRYEFAESAEDVVWRRTKQGMGMTPEQIAALDEWMQTDHSPQSETGPDVHHG